MKKRRSNRGEYMANKNVKVSGEKTFTSLAKAAEYLKSKGFKVGITKLYADKTLINRQPNRTFLQSDIDNYARQFLNKINSKDDLIEQSLSDKLRYDIEIARQNAIKLKFRNEIEEGMYVLQSDTEQMLAVRASFLKQGLENFIHSVAPRLIETINGDTNKTPELIEIWLDELAILLHQYSRPLKFGVDRNKDN